MKYHKINSLFKRDDKHKFTQDYTCPEFSYLENLAWEGTEKVDGTNIRIYKTGQVKYHGRTDNAQIPSTVIPIIEKIREKLLASDLPDSTILYGEAYGAKIQNGGHYIPDGQNFVLFDTNISGNWQPRNLVEEAAKSLGILVTPVIGLMTLPEWVSAITLGAFKQSALHTGARNEGVVLRPKTELRTRSGQRVITKLKYVDFK